MIYRHKKTGNLYEKVIDAIDCTNDRDGTEVVIYRKADEGLDAQLFVRERREFEEKFHAENV
jgi:hypothetical protein